MSKTVYTTDGAGNVYRLPESTRCMDCSSCKRLTYRHIKKSKENLKERSQMLPLEGYMWTAQGHKRPLCRSCYVGALVKYKGIRKFSYS